MNLQGILDVIRYFPIGSDQNLFKLALFISTKLSEFWVSGKNGPLLIILSFLDKKEQFEKLEVTKAVLSAVKILLRSRLLNKSEIQMIFRQGPNFGLLMDIFKLQTERHERLVREGYRKKDNDYLKFVSLSFVYACTKGTTFLSVIREIIKSLDNIIGKRKLTNEIGDQYDIKNILKSNTTWKVLNDYTVYVYQNYDDFDFIFNVAMFQSDEFTFINSKPISKIFTADLMSKEYHNIDTFLLAARNGSNNIYDHFFKQYLDHKKKDSTLDEFLYDNLVMNSIQGSNLTIVDSVIKLCGTNKSDVCFPSDDRHGCCSENFLKVRYFSQIAKYGNLDIFLRFVESGVTIGTITRVRYYPKFIFGDDVVLDMVSYGKKDIVSWYIRKGRLDWRIVNGIPIELAIDFGHEEIARMLIDRYFRIHTGKWLYRIGLDSFFYLKSNIIDTMIRNDMVDIFERTIYLTSNGLTSDRYLFGHWENQIIMAVNSESAKIIDFLLSVAEFLTKEGRMWDTAETSSSEAVMYGLLYFIDYIQGTERLTTSFDIFELIVDPSKRKYTFENLNKFTEFPKQQKLFKHSSNRWVWAGTNNDQLSTIVRLATKGNNIRILEWILKNKSQSRGFIEPLTSILKLTIEMLKMFLRINPPLATFIFEGLLNRTIKDKLFDFAFELLKDERIDPNEINPYIKQKDIPPRIHKQLEKRHDWAKPGEFEQLLGDIREQDFGDFKKLVKQYEKKYDPKHEPFASGVIFHTILEMSKPENEEEDEFWKKKMRFLELAYESPLFKLNETLLILLLKDILVQSRYSFSSKLRRDLEKIKKKKLMEERRLKKNEEDKIRMKEEGRKAEDRRAKMKEEIRKNEKIRRIDEERRERFRKMEEENVVKKK